MAQTFVEKVTASRQGKRLYEQERAILEVTELICKLMERQNVSKSELARRIGKSKAYITQLLDGRTNMTLRTISDVLFALDSSLRVREESLSRVASGRTARAAS
jgi:transcriptional regulator with XRE-family HTH domain